MSRCYYVGLLAGANDHDAVEHSGEGRAINRHDYTLSEIEAALERPVVGRILELVRLRASHPAFAGRLVVESPGASSLRMSWSAGEESCTLDVDLIAGVTRIGTRGPTADHEAGSVLGLGDVGAPGPR